MWRAAPVHQSPARVWTLVRTRRAEASWSHAFVPVRRRLVQDELVCAFDRVPTGQATAGAHIADTAEPTVPRPQYRPYRCRELPTAVGASRHRASVTASESGARRGVCVAPLSGMRSLPW